MRKKVVVTPGKGVRICLRSSRKAAPPNLAAAAESSEVRKEVKAMAKSDKEGESTGTCGVPSVMEVPERANTLDDQAEVTAESCSSAAENGSSVAGSCSSEASQEAAARHAGTQEGSAAGCEAAMESAEAAGCVAMEVAEEALRESSETAAMAQVGAMHLCDGGETAASNGAGKPETVGSAGPNQTQIIRALRDINILEEKRNILEGSIDNMVAGLGALRGAQRAKAIQKIAYLNKDLEDIESNITGVLAVIEPWRELYHNRRRFQEMERNQLKKVLKDSFAFPKGTVTPAGGNGGPSCADSWDPLTDSLPCNNVNTVSVSGGSVPHVSVQCDMAAGSTYMAAGSTGIAAGSTGMAAGSTHMAAGSTHMAAGSTHMAAGSTHMAAGSTHMAAGSTHMAAGSTHMAAGSTHMAAGSTHMAAGSTGMAAGSTNMAAGSTGMAAGSTGAAAGSTDMAAGSTGMAAGSTGMAAGSTDMAAGSTNMAAGSTDMTAPLTDKTVCDAAARVGESGATEGAGNPPVNTESEGAQGRRGAWDGKRLFQQNVSMAGESAASRRKNVVKIKWEKERGEFPGRRFVGRNLIKQSLGFTPADVSGLISVTDTEFDLGFKLSQGLDDFWRRYEGKKGAPEWEGFRVTPVSRPDTKTVTIMFKTESVHPDDVLIWLKRQCTVLSPFTPLYDEEGFWVGGWKVQVKLHMNLHVPKHLPNSFFIGKDRGVCFYPGQPRVCFKCGSNRHFAVKCTVLKCALCGETGHPSKECQKIRCNLCLKLGHAHSSCPDAWHNMVAECSNLEEEMSLSMELLEEGNQTSEVVEPEREAVQPESSAPVTKVVGGAQGRLPKGNSGKKEGEQRVSKPRGEGEWSVAGGKSSEKNKNIPPKMTVATDNRFVLPDGKTWGDLAEEEEERLREEERKEERKARALAKKDRKKRERKESGEESQEAESPGEEVVVDLEGAESTPKVQVKRRGDEGVGGRQKQNKT
uniref:CCHC-type domain-containing protein n=1 Tax=Xenopus tropicalis TaxID=8364 RepID=A0A1B8Y242_XENTR